MVQNFLLKKYLSNKSIIILSLLLLFVVLFFWNDVLNLRAEEPRRAIVAMEMVLSGEYIAPQINGWAYYNKPPVFNWLLAGASQIFNSFEEWVLRIPSILSFLLMGCMNYFFVKKFISKEVALLSSLFFFTSADILFYGSVNAGEIDLFFSLVSYLQVISIFFFYSRGDFLKMFLISYFLAAIGTLTKGPPSIAFQGITLICWLFYKREFKLFFGWKHILSGCLFLGIVGGYFFVYDQHNDGLGFAVRLFQEASMKTGLDAQSSNVFMSSLRFPFYFLQLLLPWSLFSLFFFRTDFIQKVKHQKLLLFAGIFILSNILIYWFTSDYRSRYLYMFFPFFCMYLAYFFAHRKRDTLLDKVWQKLFLGIISIIFLGLISTLFLPSYFELIDYFQLKIVLLLVMSIGIGAVYWKFKTMRISAFVLFIVFCRLTFNVLYLPLAQENSSKQYEKEVNKLLAITQQEPIFWYGKRPYTFSTNASIGSIQLEEVNITSAPLLAYQIPYYITKSTDQIMQFDTVMQANQFYLAPSKSIDTNLVHVYGRIEDKWLKQELLLVKRD